MLGKLLKYEISAMGRQLLPLFGSWLAISVLMVIMFNTIAGIWPIFTGLMYGLLIVAYIVIGVMALIIIIQRFYKNFMKREGYLTMTLPVSINKHIWSKGISGTFWSVIGSVCGCLSILIIIMGASTETAAYFFDRAGKYINLLVNYVGIGNLILVLLEAIVLVIVATGQTVMTIYVSIAVGHLWQSHRVVGAILAYLGINTLLLILTINAPGPNLTFVMGYEIIDSVRQLQFILLYGIIYSVVVYAIFHFVSQLVLKKKLNLE